MLLLGLLRGLGSSTTSSERLIGNSSIFLLGSFIVQLYVFIDSHCHPDRRLRSLTSRAPADQKKFCVALCFSVSRNSVSHACTAILRLVHDSDSGRASACTNFVIFFRFSRFSPFAEEGFTCFDHSVMSKKKISA